MITTGAREFLLAVIVCGGMLAACDGSPEQTDTQVSPTPQSGAPKSAGLAPDMVAAVSGGNTATVLGVHFALRAAPTVNQALPIDIVIVPHRDFTALQAHFETRDGLTLTAGNVLAPQGDAPAEKRLTHQLVLLAAREGVFMVTVVVETEGADGTVTRIFSIPVIVAPSAAAGAAPASAPPAASDGIVDEAAPAAK